MEDKKIIYIDESNISTDTGYSVYCGVFIFHIDKDFLNKEIISIENELKIKYLHWIKLSWKSRLKFAKKIRNLNFLCRILFYKNPINQEGILENFISQILNFEDDVYKIVIDGKKGNRYIHKFKRRLKIKSINYNKLLFADDKDEPLVRLADFIAGLSRSYVNSPDIDNKYIFELLKHKIKILN